MQGLVRSLAGLLLGVAVLVVVAAACDGHAGKTPHSRLCTSYSAQSHVVADINPCLHKNHQNIWADLWSHKIASSSIEAGLSANCSETHAGNASLISDAGGNIQTQRKLNMHARLADGIVAFHACVVLRFASELLHWSPVGSTVTAQRSRRGSAHTARNDIHALLTRDDDDDDTTSSTSEHRRAYGQQTFSRTEQVALARKVRERDGRSAVLALACALVALLCVGVVVARRASRDEKNATPFQEFSSWWCRCCIKSYHARVWLLLFALALNGCGAAAQQFDPAEPAGDPPVCGIRADLYILIRSAQQLPLSCYVPQNALPATPRLRFNTEGCNLLGKNCPFTFSLRLENPAGAIIWESSLGLTIFDNYLSNKITTPGVWTVVITTAFTSDKNYGGMIVPGEDGNFLTIPGGRGAFWQSTITTPCNTTRPCGVAAKQLQTVQCRMWDSTAALAETYCSYLTKPLSISDCDIKACVVCALGSYAPPPKRQDECIACPTGSYCNATGLIAPSGNCPSGYSCLVGTIQPLPCPIGQYQDVTNQGACKSCPIGRYSASAGASQCRPCALGTYSGSIGTIVCTPCSPGTFANVTESTACSLCPAGRYGASGLSSNTCSGGCAAGYWCPSGSSSATQIACGSVSVFCPPGSASPTPVSVGYSSTTPVDGTSATMAQQTACPAGSYCDGSGAVKACFAGTFQNQSTQAVCATCPAGSYSTVGAQRCESCAVGSFSSAGSISCTPCRPGTSTATTGSLSCQNCTAGRFASGGGSSGCEECPPGSFSSEAAVFCTSCSPGYEPVAMTCRPCPPNSASGQGVLCTPCADGQVAVTSGLAFCTQCDPGQTPTADPVSGVQTCSTCPGGTSSQGGAPCTPCSPGTFASAGAFSCSPCSQGTASNATGLSASSCPQCAPGFYQDGSGQTSCLACAPQYFSNSNGSLSCQLCTTQVTPGRTDCVTKACRSNYYYGTDGECHPCALGSGGNGGICSVCDPGYYTPAAGAACTSCAGIDGLVCSGGLANVAPGYWAYLVRDDAAGAELYRTAACPTDFCPGSALQQLNDTSAAEGIQFCSPPRLNSASNLMCGACDVDHLPWGGQCVPCTKVNGALVFGGLVISFGLVVFLLLAGGSAAGNIAIFLFFVQTAALEIGSVAKWINWLHLINLDTNSSSACLAPWTPFEQTLFSLLMPVLLMLELGAVGCVHYGVHRWFQARPAVGSNVEKKCSLLARLMRNFSVDKYVAGLTSILLFSYTQVTTASMQYLYCVDVGPSRVLFAAPTVDCRSSEYRAYLVPVILALVLFVAGFPVAVTALLWRNKETLFVPDGAQLPTSISGFLVRWSPLVKAYQPRAWFWQPLVLFRRTCFVLTSVLLVQQPHVRFMSFTFLNFGSLLLHEYARPYHVEALNRLETLSYVLLVCVSVMLTGYTPPYDAFVQVMIFLFIVPCAAGIVAYIALQQWRVIQLKLSSRVESQAVHPADKQGDVELYPLPSDKADPGTSRPRERLSEAVDHEDVSLESTNATMLQIGARSDDDLVSSTAM